jgi:hypothetical protein
VTPWPDSFENVARAHFTGQLGGHREGAFQGPFFIHNSSTGLFIEVNGLSLIMYVMLTYDGNELSARQLSAFITTRAAIDNLFTACHTSRSHVAELVCFSAG